ncbi:sodium- and chloride-dependent glycine transporter 2-like isoform X1 [Dermacentor albipictus]|uniref:sodium- and chloride-dependent glycine transporter 2-like isoform X1 n=1 Tax=Dermacentor albipictus TaxID=60249 RepID=UPI0031FE1535
MAPKGDKAKAARQKRAVPFTSSNSHSQASSTKSFELDETSGSSSRSARHNIHPSTSAADVPQHLVHSLAEPPDRRLWSSEMQLILSCAAIAIGMANIWRFPKMLYENGGGSFLLAYMVALVAVGYPLFYLELILGQYTRLGPGAVTRCVPMARGVEVCAGLVSFLMSGYLHALLAHSLLQLLLSFTDFNLVPLSGCYGFWEQQLETCYRAERRLCGLHPSVQRSARKGHQNRSSLPLHMRPFKYDDAVMDCVNVTETMSEHFFHTSVGLRSHRQEWRVGSLHLELLLCLGLMWVLLYVCLASGLRTPRLSAVTLLPIGLTLALMIETLWREGATFGIWFMLVPHWRELLQITVWTRAVEQVLFTIGVSYGPVVTFGSFCRRFENVHRVVFMVTLLTLAASLMYSIIVFSALGSMALSLNIPVKDVVHGGQSVIFVAMSKFSVHWISSSLFFLLVLIAGTSSQLSMVDVALTHWADCCMLVQRNRRHFAIGYCVVAFLIGLPFVTEAGLYLVQLVDSQVVGFLLSYVAFFELLAVMWIYGLEHLKLDVMLMHGELSAVKLECAWCVVVPAALAVSLVTSLLSGCSSLRLGPIQFPVHVCYVGWSLVIVGALQVPLWAVLEAIRNQAKLEQCLVPASTIELGLAAMSSSEPTQLPTAHRRF